MNPLLSIIIPSYNGAHKLPNLLSSIAKQEGVDGLYEVIVVVDGSTDHSLDVLSQPAYHFVKTSYQPNAGRSVARNAGAHLASGEILMFMDDDTRLSSPRCFEQHLQHHRTHPNSMLVGKVIMDHQKIGTDFHSYYAQLQQKWTSNNLQKEIISTHNFIFTTSHFSTSAVLFHQLGGFDARLTDAEDYDFAMRALIANYSIYYDPQIQAFHDDFPSCRQYIKRQVQYKLSHKALKSLTLPYPNEIFKETPTPKKWRAAIAKIFSHEKWVNWVDKEMLRYLPSSIRFKLYAEIIYAHTLKGLQLLR